MTLPPTVPQRDSLQDRRICSAREAESHFAIASSLYREMGMTHWVPQVEMAVRRGGPEPPR